MSSHQLARVYSKCHDLMRNIDGLLPQEAFDELLKLLFLHECLSENRTALSAVANLKGTKLAKELRRQFRSFLAEDGSPFLQGFSGRDFKLSDEALVATHLSLASIDLVSTDIDLRGSALREFMTPEIRRGLGIFLTPDDVVRAMVEYCGDLSKKRVLDLACGSGTFLIESCKAAIAKDSKSVPTVHGIDKNPRMLLLAGLNLGHAKQAKFISKLGDSLFDLPSEEDGFKVGTFDFVLTNPPFGVYLESLPASAHGLRSCFDKAGNPIARQQSELVFIERALSMLKENGLLAIVLPRSVITNTQARYAAAREAIDRLGYLEAGFSLPPETFAVGGAQTTTCVLFIRKRTKRPKTDQHKIPWVDIRNVGFDQTGRLRDGSELSGVAKRLRDLQAGKRPAENESVVELASNLETLSDLPNAKKGGSAASRSGVKLRDVTTLVRTGRTPARSQYADDGLFLVKVGNLTGQGIDWTPRDRNFAVGEETSRRKKLGLLLETGDILLTSSAHSVVYIAKKVDIVTTIPERFRHASFVGEIMLIRPDKQKVNAWALHSFLRSAQAQSSIQQMVRGQTAHLHHEDLLELEIPASVVEPDAGLQKVMNLLMREAAITSELSELYREGQEILDQLF